MLDALPQEVRKAAQGRYRLWLRDFRHPSVQFKRIEGEIWSARVTRDYRALARVSGDTVQWMWIGPHAEYDAILRSR